MSPTIGSGDGDDLAGEIPRQPLELKEDEPDKERVDAKQDDFHYAFPVLICASSSANGGHVVCASSLVADSPPGVFVRVIDIRAIGHLVLKRASSRPQSQAIGQRQSAEDERE